MPIADIFQQAAPERRQNDPAPFTEAPMAYQLFYWNGIQERGEFVRLAHEEAGAAYIYVVRHEHLGIVTDAMLELPFDSVMSETTRIV